MSQRVICRVGALDELQGIVAETGAGRILLVTGRTSYAASGAESRFSALFSGRSVTRFCNFAENPKIENVVEGIDAFRRADPDLVIAVGGGTALDIAKLVNILAACEKDPLDYIEGRQELQPGGRPLIAIPTTAGSGSQATPFSVVYVDKTKHSAGHPSMLPDVAIVDPGLLTSLPKQVAASSGLDALCQGIESYWSIHATEASRAKAREAIVGAWAHLATFVNQPDDASRLAMAHAAHLAGEAISITRTTAPHAISYPMTAHYGVSHGHAVGLLLPSILLFNSGVTDADCLHSEGPPRVCRTLEELASLLGADSTLGAARRFESVMDAIGLTRTLLPSVSVPLPTSKPSSKTGSILNESTITPDVSPPTRCDRCCCASLTARRSTSVSQYTYPLTKSEEFGNFCLDRNYRYDRCNEHEDSATSTETDADARCTHDERTGALRQRGPNVRVAGPLVRARLGRCGAEQTPAGGDRRSPLGPAAGCSFGWGSVAEGCAACLGLDVDLGGSAFLWLQMAQFDGSTLKEACGSPFAVLGLLFRLGRHGRGGFP